MLEAELLAKLIACDYHVRLRVLAMALSTAGYGDVAVMDRWTPGQKTRHGGFELLCDLSTTLGRRHTVVKVLKDEVRVRNMDEMAGTLMRNDISAGLIVSPSGMVEDVAFLAGSGRYRSVDIRVLAGLQLARLLVLTGTGVRDGRPDEELFAKLAKQGAGGVR